MARPAWKTAAIKNLANAVNQPGGSQLLRNQYASGAAATLGYKESTVCKYVELELGKHFRANW
jgi:hypothetical protein